MRLFLVLMPFLLMPGLLAAGPARAQETRAVVDHAGQRLGIPDRPQRLVSLHDWTVTVMAHELGAPLLGSIGRLDNRGRLFIRSARELFGLGFDSVAFASLHGQLDLERILALEPDLIIANLGDAGDVRDQLADIAPTLMFDPMNGQAPLDQYAELARWLGREDVFAAKLAAYRARVDRLRGRLAGGGGAPTYAMVLPNPKDGTLTVMRRYGAVTTALEDLGFTPVPLVRSISPMEASAVMSPEVIASLDADYLFTAHVPDRGDDLDSMLDAFDRVVPGYRSVLRAYRNGRIHSLPRFHVYPTSFAGLNLMLDLIEEALP